jgi:hypothetical protein
MEYNNNNYDEENNHTDNEYDMYERNYNEYDIYEMNYNEHNMYSALPRRSERNKDKVMRKNRDRRMQEQWQGQQQKA